MSMCGLRTAQSPDCNFMPQTLFAPARDCEKVNSFPSRNLLNFHEIKISYLPSEVNSLWRRRAGEKRFRGKSGTSWAARVNGHSPKTAPKLGFSGAPRRAGECLEKDIGGGRSLGRTGLTGFSLVSGKNTGKFDSLRDEHCRNPCASDL